jgi:hypothetical protein
VPAPSSSSPRAPWPHLIRTGGHASPPSTAPSPPRRPSPRHLRRVVSASPPSTTPSPPGCDTSTTLRHLRHLKLLQGHSMPLMLGRFATSTCAFYSCRSGSCHATLPSPFPPSSLRRVAPFVDLGGAGGGDDRKRLISSPTRRTPPPRRRRPP